MPQLDILTFSSSYFWFLVIFFGFFYVFSLVFLPNIYFIFRLRESYTKDLEAISHLSTAFTEALSSLNIKDPQPIIFESDSKEIPLQASKLTRRSLDSYASTISLLGDKHSEITLLYHSVFYFYSYSTLTPPLSALIAFTAVYGDTSIE